MSTPSRIAIDGPAASGKTSVGNQIARELGYRFIDTGLMYRAMAWAAVRDGLPHTETDQLTQLANTVHIDLVSGPVNGKSHLLLDGTDITNSLRTNQVESIVSAISSISGIRLAMVKHQRQIARNGSIVMVGRDIGTVVLPDANLKIFLTATPEERARRRQEEMAHAEHKKTFRQILDELNKRDSIDSNRNDSPLRIGADSVLIDSSDMNQTEVVKYILDMIKGQNGNSI